MPTIEENLNTWSSYEWPEEGDEWSAEWGGTQYVWYGTIFPRIQAFLPTESILEIAPGYGRCTQYLLSFCRELNVVDLTEKCIKACQKRFESHSHIKYFINDGKSLDMIADNSIDFVFSWDSLVHAESDILFSYLKYLSVKLKHGGFGFIHHSNMGSFKDPKTGELTVKNPHWRASSMTSEIFRDHCDAVGLECVAQENVAWGGKVLHDCFSLFTRHVTKNNIKTVIFENVGFMSEAHNMKKISELYNPTSLLKSAQGLEGNSGQGLLSRVISRLIKARQQPKNNNIKTIKD